MFSGIGQCRKVAIEPYSEVDILGVNLRFRASPELTRNRPLPLRKFPAVRRRAAQRRIADP